jgi:hypothetical protein
MVNRDEIHPAGCYLTSRHQIFQLKNSLEEKSESEPCVLAFSTDYLLNIQGVSHQLGLEIQPENSYQKCVKPVLPNLFAYL